MGDMSLGAGVAIAGSVVAVAFAISKAASDIWAPRSHPDIDALWTAVKDTNTQVARLTTELAVMVEKVQTLVETVKELAQSLK